MGSFCENWRPLSVLTSMRTPRVILPDHTLVEVTQRTVRGQHLLRPDRELNEIFLGILGRAQRLHPVKVVGAACLSNHYHLLLQVPDALTLARFMGYFSGNLAKEVNRLRGLSGPVWCRRYTHVPITSEPEAQVERLVYLLSQGVKEHLVKRCHQWPGIHVARYFLHGGPWSGVWFDRTRQNRSRSRSGSSDRYRFSSDETVWISPLPCLEHLPPEEYRQWVLQMIRKIERRYQAQRFQDGSGVLGRRAILRQNPLDVADQIERRPVPRVHARSRQARREFLKCLRIVVDAYRDASRKLRAGLSASFPAGTFPPALPFATAPRAP